MTALVSKLRRFVDKDYRDGYLHTHVRASVAYQLKALRRKFGLSQRLMAKRVNKTQSVISRLESDDYGQMSLQTLLDIASGLDVALIVRFVSYPEFLKHASNMSEAALQPETIDESFASALQEQDERPIRLFSEMAREVREPRSAHQANTQISELSALGQRLAVRQPQWYARDTMPKSAIRANS